MQLQELFDHPVDVAHSERENGSHVYQATLSDGTKLNVSFVHTNEDGRWELSFTRSVLRRNGRHALTIDKTGTGNEVEVFSTVIGVIRKFIDEFDPTSIKFAAEIPFGDDRQMSRANLYRRMAKSLGSNYDFIEDDKSYMDEIGFVIQKKSQTIGDQV